MELHEKQVEERTKNLPLTYALHRKRQLSWTLIWKYSSPWDRFQFNISRRKPKNIWSLASTIGAWEQKMIKAYILWMPLSMKWPSESEYRELKTKLWSFHRNYTVVLRSSGYGDLTKSKLLIAIKHIIQKLKPLYLKTRMHDILEWGKDDSFEKSAFQLVHAWRWHKGEKASAQKRGVLIWKLQNIFIW